MSTLKELQRRLKILKVIIASLVTVFLSLIVYFKRATRKGKIIIALILIGISTVLFFVAKDYVHTKKEISKLSGITISITDVEHNGE